MPSPTLANRTALACTGVLLALASVGCNALEDFARDVYDNAQKGAAPPPKDKPSSCLGSEECPAGMACTIEAAAANCLGPCQPGTCVPKKDPPPVIDPAKACAASESCAAGEVCSVELGVCNSPPGCGGPETACPAVCYGTCAPKKDPPPPPPKSECATDADCRAFSNHCEGCGCEALANSEKEPACNGKIVSCFADPCGNQNAVCNAGQCVLATATPTACEKRTMGGPTSCKPAGTWKQYAHDDCAASGAVLSEISTREPCGGDSSVYIDYVCCK
jgi:hypothetical protein